MRTVLSLIVAIVAITSIIACQEACDFVECQNGGQCIEGDCHCPDDYRGKYCENWIDPCEEVFCLNDGTCAGGICDCASGYTGDTCQNEIRAIFLGDYNVIHSCTSGSLSYDVNVAEDTTVTNVLLTNLYNSGYVVSGVVESDSLAIHTQVFGTGEITGTGILEDDILSLSYVVLFGMNTDSCTAICQLQ